MPSLQIISASTSGHTDHVLRTLCEVLAAQKPDLTIASVRAELAKDTDFAAGDVLLLACGTWNTGSVEGQLNPHMHALLMDRCASVDLKKKKTLVIGLGDQRYRYTCRAADRLEKFVNDHNGTLLTPTLRIVNEPYGQEEAVRAWTDSILPLLS